MISFAVLWKISEPIVYICKFYIIEGLFFLEEDESGMTEGLLKVLQDYRLICCVIIVPAMDWHAAREDWTGTVTMACPLATGMVAAAWLA